MIFIRRNIILLSSVVSLFSLAATTTTQAQQQVDKTEKLVGQWLDIERQTAALNSEWQEEKPMLEQRLTLLNAEYKQLQQILNKSQDVQSEVDKQRTSLLNEQSELEQQQQTIGEFVTRLNQTLSELKGQLPPVMLKSWQKEDKALTDETNVSQQLQVALAKLSKLSEFANRISVNEGTVTTENGQLVLVKQLYLGVGQAWFVNHDNTMAGTGHATADGWQWTFDSNLDATEIAKAVAIFEKQKQAELISLPLTLSAVEAIQ
ncbi:DUF3450 family protein [Neptunicella marina]|uniref:DUF3450 family protein n=1 Tax=Neptunicella marina TaxID=2125989 RepID=A0A8J6ISH9_9ALTE|nr:DUF3450 family protein [Neptunicella marina]